MTDIKSLFESIKTEMTKDTGQTNRSQFLRTEVGNTYTVRLLPNVKDPSKTFFHYYTHGWTSFATGQYINQISPQTWGERDPIGEARYRITKTGTPEEKREGSSHSTSRKLDGKRLHCKRSSKTQIITVIQSCLRFGRQLHKVVMEAMQGDEADELGPRIFDLGKDGCDFRIKVEKARRTFQHTYHPSLACLKAIEGMDDSKAKETYENITDLEKRIYSKKVSTN